VLLLVNLSLEPYITKFLFLNSMSQNSKKIGGILITGGAGYIGSHTAMVLHKRGWSLIAILPWQEKYDGHDLIVKSVLDRERHQRKVAAA